MGHDVGHRACVPAAILLALLMPSRMRAAYAANARKVLAEDVARALTGPRRLVLDDEAKTPE